jgi:hypothetical protein
MLDKKGKREYAMAIQRLKFKTGINGKGQNTLSFYTQTGLYYPPIIRKYSTKVRSRNPANV